MEDYHEIIPNLFLGSKEYDVKLLERLKIDVALCVAPEDQVPSFTHPTIQFVRFPISFQLPDSVSKDNMINATNKCIELLQEQKRIYLHCVAGYNRSAAVAVLVLTNLFKIDKDEAISVINEIRKIAPQKHLALLKSPPPQSV
jgi:protein-tyrosine phosphatase